MGIYEAVGEMHSALSHGFDAIRHGNPTDTRCTAHTQLEVDLAEVILRILSFAAKHELDVVTAIEDKVDYDRRLYADQSKAKDS